VKKIEKFCPHENPKLFQKIKKEKNQLIKFLKHFFQKFYRQLNPPESPFQTTLISLQIDNYAVTQKR
jgi:hypothetical protein